MERKIEPKLVTLIDKKLIGNGRAQEAIKAKDARTVMICAAEALIGVREEGGNNNGPIVKLIQETVGGASREAWCMSFVQTCIAYAELKTGKKSPVVVSEHCMSTWNLTKKAQRVKFSPLPGAIIIWQKGKSQSGHTGFVIGADEKTMLTVEGNTESGVSSKGGVVRDGGGVYQCKRSRVGTGSMKVVGFLKPF